MSDLMRHTKAELVEMIEGMKQKSDESRNTLKKDLAAAEQKYTDLKSRLAGLEEEIGTLKNERDRLKKEYDQQKETLEDEIQHTRHSHKDLQDRFVRAEEEKSTLRMERDDLNKDYTLLKEKFDRISHDKVNLIEQFTILEEDFQELQNRLRSCEERYQTTHELFKLFVDNQKQKIMLLDSGYTFQFINAGALETLGLSDSDGLLNRKIFDFIAYDDALKLKDKIDKAFLRGDREKVKDIKFQRDNGNSVKLKMKIVRVRFEDKPSVKLMLK